MKYYIYILYSGYLLKFYVGYTKDVTKRLMEHNTGKAKFTSTGMPWRIIYTIQCESKTEAIRLERKIKKRGIKRYLQDIGNFAFLGM